MSQAAHQRVMVKLSGEVLGGKTGAGLDQPMLKAVAADLVAARKLRATIGVVVGGGNFMRGATVSGTGLPRETGDAMGMLATVINALALEAAVTAAGGTARTLSAIAMPQICESYSRQRALQLLGDGHVVIFAGGTGNPYFTTDTTAVLRAAEMNCDAVLKATNVDGVYSADPKRDPKATRFEKLSHADAIARDLKVMDATAFALARENRMPIIVFSILDAGAITAVLSGKARATTVSSD